MKSLTKMTYTDKAFLLHQLFPNDIATLLDFIEQMAITLHEETAWRESWDDEQYNAADWLAMALTIAGRIQHFGAALQLQPVLFSEQLFTAPYDAFSVYCLQQLTTQRRHPNPHFVLTVELLFFP